MKPASLNWIVGALLATTATIGVGGRCDPKEALTDSAKDALNIHDKGPLEERRSLAMTRASRGL